MIHELRQIEAGDRGVVLTFAMNGELVRVALTYPEAQNLGATLERLTPAAVPMLRPATAGRVLVVACGMLARWRSRALRASSVETLRFIDDAASELGALITLISQATPARAENDPS